MRGELAVRINDGFFDRHLTSAVRDLSFRKTAPGGHESASMRLLLPRDTFRDLGPADKVYIYDARTGRTIWEGYTENPGVTDGPAGQEFDLAAMGGVILASDRSEKLIYADRDLTKWTPMLSNHGSAGVDTAEDETYLRFQAGAPVGTGAWAGWKYEVFADTTQYLGYIGFTWTGGKSGTGYQMQIDTSPAGGSEATTDVAYDLTTAGGVLGRGPGGFGTAEKFVRVALRRTGGATNVADDLTWVKLTDLRIYPQFADQFGNLAEAALAPTVGRIVKDVFARLLEQCDPAASSFAETTVEVNQLAFHEGGNAAEVFEALALHEPDMLWEILHSTSNGHVFNYRPWPTSPRYEISVKDGYAAPGGDVDLCNRVTVYWTDRNGNKRATVTTQEVPALGSRVRDAEPVELPEGQGSSSNAQRIGEQVLAMKNTPPKAARAVVRRPIMDHATGSSVMPWEIEPGYLVRVRETGDDLRLTEVTYEDSDCVAELTLGEPTRSIEQLLASVQRR